MLARIKMNGYGQLDVIPVSERFRLRMVRLSATGSDGRVFISGSRADAWLSEHLTRRAARDVREGWTVRCRIDSWAYAVWCGAT